MNSTLDKRALAESTTEDEILALFGCVQIVESISSILWGEQRYNVELQHTSDESGSAEIKNSFQLTLSRLLEMCSLISLISGDLHNALSVRSMPVDGIIRILDHEAVIEFMTRRHYTAHGIFAKADIKRELPRRFRIAEQRERRDRRWNAALENFLTLNAQLTSDSSLLDLLLMFDPLMADQADIDALQQAFKDQAAMTRWLDRSEHYHILDGLERMLGFSEGLHSFLGNIDDLPILQGRIWIHYSSWLGNCGIRIRELANILVNVVRDMSLPYWQTYDSTHALQTTFQDLTSPSRYAKTLLALTNPPINIPLITLQKSPVRPVDIDDIAALNRYLLAKTGDLKLSVRTVSSLQKDDIVYIGDLVQLSERDLLDIPRVGRKSLNEIVSALSTIGLRLSMKIPGWPPRNIEEMAIHLQKEFE